MSQTKFSLPWLEISKERLAELAIAEKACYEVAKVRRLTSTAGVWGHKESDTMEQLCFTHFISTEEETS